MPLSGKLVASLLSVACVMPLAAWSADDGTEVVTPAQAATDARVAAIARDFAQSPDLALRILYSTDGLVQRADGTFAVREVVPVAVLVELARGSTDPLVLDLLLRHCGMPNDGCDRLALAKRWVEADAQNQVAWLVLAGVQRQAGDVDGARATILRAAQASTWHDYYDDAVRRGARALPKDLDAAERVAALRLLFAKGGIVIAFDATHALGDACNQGEPIRTACARIVATMVRDGNMMALNVAVANAARAGEPRTTIAAYQQKADALYGALRGIAPSWSPDDIEDPATLRRTIASLDLRIASGERGILERYLVDHHLSEADAAKAEVATLSRGQVERRRAMLERRDLREAALRTQG